ncbi:MAG: radical SAM/SPASM domain-containing protein [Bacillota bacterium]
MYKSKERTADGGHFPKVVLIDTVSYCNLRCSMCGHRDMKRKKGIMDINLYKKIIDEISEQDKSVRVWLVFFGEALILRRKGLFDMIAYAKNKGLTDVVLNSNGNLLDEETARGLIYSGLDAIYFGIDAHSDDTYSKYRVGGNYNRVVDNILRLVHLKEKNNSESPDVYVQFVEMDGNRHELNGFIDFWKNKNVTVKIRPMVSWAGLVQAPNLNEELKRWPCYWAMQTMSIADDGRVVMCAVDVDARYVAGDIKNQSLEEVWNGRLKEIRDLHNSGQFSKLPHPCNECLDWQSASADFYKMEK